MSKWDADRPYLSPEPSTWGGQRVGGGYTNLHAHDPRTSSAQSLAPSIPDTGEQPTRTLLIIYIHGFMGNDSSFQSFPAHVHKYLKNHMPRTHTIHSKIYPKYKTYKAIEVARDNFGRWLNPHESDTTDVILVGHSMGGLLSADVVLKPSTTGRATFFQHRILGTVNLDAPLLGLHPGIVVSGISSLFRKKPDPPKSFDEQDGGSSGTPSRAGSQEPYQFSDAGSVSSASQPPTPSPQTAGGLLSRMTFDPNFNPNYPNDVRIMDRGWWKNVVHFVKKHNSEGLVDAATHHIMSHLEFGSCLADFNGLKLRYETLRRLEDVDDIKHHGFPHVPPRVRFVQYYTVCHGYPKQPKTPKSPDPENSENSWLDKQDGSVQPQRLSDIHKEEPTALIHPEEDVPDDRSITSLEILDPDPIAEEAYDGEQEDVKAEKAETDGAGPAAAEPDEAKIEVAKTEETKPEGANAEEVKTEQEGVDDEDEEMPEIARAMAKFKSELPKLESPGPAPESPDLSKFTDKEVRQQVEKEAKKRRKAHEKAVKNYEKDLKDRKKLIAKHRKKLAKELEPTQKQRGVLDAAARTALDDAIHDQESIADAAAAAAPPRPPPRPPAQGETSTAASLVEGAPADDKGPLDAKPGSSLAPAISVASSSDPAEPPRGSSSSKDKQKHIQRQEKPEKPKKDRKFCNLPSKINGQRDPKWIKIFMKDADEVAAHTGLFFPGPHYERLVGDVGDMIVQWVQDDATKRAIVDAAAEAG
ncbi:hypothetical protein JX266_006770 [Neoarthrinium moseri]|uniref:uncharacterized protein n=1 Tax=Neoarthrinium moseri TaxID=1658444 RepID=UPI001FDE317E|nr:uncharacterized protein JN550_012209 [Neoarthrinium moseri]KAI1847230.1 hypothetical protein JX266_006770 [Neoarthrinium moseri]KAI1859196.1 hypothetical protein JN550_012209 [Neoarthrinium moseri]